MMIWFRITNAILGVLIAIWWFVNRSSDMAEPIVAVAVAILVLVELLGEFVVRQVTSQRKAQNELEESILPDVLDRIEREESNISQVIAGRRKGDKIIEEYPVELLEPHVPQLKKIRRFAGLADRLQAELDKNKMLPKGGKEFEQLQEVLSDICDLAQRKATARFGRWHTWLTSLLVIGGASICVAFVRLPAENHVSPSESQSQRIRPNPSPSEDSEGNITEARTDQQQTQKSRHVVAAEAEYYTTGPQQGRPPDGTFPAGTKVSIVEKSGSYLLVKSESGVEAYVAADAIEQREGTTMDVSGLVEGGNQFAFDLFQQLRSEDGNLFFSPSSISTALAMTYAGAAGETEAEMARTLHFQMPKEQLHDGMRALQAFWTTPDKKKGIRLNLANRLWGQESYEFQPEFLSVTRDSYGAELARLNFAQTEAARRTINGWVEDQTEDKITELIPVGVLSGDTKLVLTNAVYFHGIWSDPFKKDRTKDEDFHLTATDKIKVPLMHRWDEFRYGAVDDIQILELPYGDGSLSMVVLLPKEIDGLAALEAKLTFQNLQRWLGSVKHEDEVKVYLPRFKTTSQFQMADTLKAMGMERAFDANAADFSEMTGGRDLYISEVIHKAFVDVNEEGTEAAAATGVVMAPTAAPIQEPKEPPVFRADHPFVFMIRDNRNGAIMFLGRITNPLE